ncbi:MAG: acyl-CoA dehydrogenase family protein [Deltaproteobacteria bacterium]|nr:acyl-CoA dehydrogenase family protein [Deltaproteobacteria bacterium]
MDFEIPPEYEQLKRSVRDFLLSELEPISRRLDEEQAFPLDVHRKAGKLGFIGAHLPEEYGGGGDLFAKSVIYEENCRVNLGYNVSVNASDLLFANNVARHGNPEQKKKYLPPIISGEKIGCWAITEPEAGSDALSLKTTATPCDGGWVVNGSKTFITNAPIADFFIVQARLPGTSGADGGIAFILDRGVPGLSTGPKMDKLGVRCSPTAQIFMEEMRAGPEHVLGTPGEGLRQALGSLDVERSLSPFSSIGVAQACLDASARYALERKQFGKPIAKFQLIQEKLAEMAADLDVARHYCRRVVWMVTQGIKVTKEAAIAKLFASRMVSRVTTEAIQIHGGYGLMKEYNVERYFRDARILEIGAGTTEIQKIVIAREVLKEYE